MWMRYIRPHEGDPMNRNDWFTMRTEEAADGAVTLVLIDHPAGTKGDLTRASMTPSEARTMADEIAADLLADGWTLEADHLHHADW
ncbi:hypothetical protein TR51_25665 [Kitasatospora griseola]|uniref:Uncharacterized protein n=1 Tax=Kitasatospora griseola TaxID=2064 RepID=A0A0D0PPP1_KITGR|nr:hypothetical protein [Kitasatospora griseola]KIQ62427.1 hypothetical protein TR51_25665 [Kitasatospora griseola]